MAKKKLSKKQIDAILKWYVEEFLPWYEENYGGVQPMMEEDEDKKKPPPPPPPGP
jgi:hypothetical protein